MNLRYFLQFLVLAFALSSIAQDIDSPRLIKSDSLGIFITFPTDNQSNFQNEHLTLVNLDGNFEVPKTSCHISFESNGTVSHITFPGIFSKMLPEGNYMGILKSESWSSLDTPSGCTSDSQLPLDYVFDFHVFYGDTDGDRDVDYLDTSFIRNSWNRKYGEPGFNASFDFSADGIVDNSDKPILLRNHFTKLPPKLGIHLQLANDTGRSSRDHVTNDPTISGHIVGTTLLSKLMGRIEKDSNEWSDITSLVEEDGVLLIPTEAIIDLNGGNLDNGKYTFAVQALGTNNEILYSAQIEFKYHSSANCPPTFVSTPVLSADTRLIEAPVPVDLTKWTVVPYLLNSFGQPNWIIEDENTSARQRVNTTASILLSDIDVVGTPIRGSFLVDTTADDDLIGFVFGYQNDQQFYLFDWKRSDQNGHAGGITGYARYGMTVKKVKAVTSINDLWRTQGTNNVDILYTNREQWRSQREYGFELTHNPGQFRIIITDGITVVSDISIEDSAYTNGRFGFYNLSQEQVVYKGFTRENVPVQTYAYQAAAVDPNLDTLSFILVSGPDGMTINASTGLLTWSPLRSQVGEHPVTIQVSDGKGGTDEQSFVVTVVGFDNPPTVSLQSSQAVIDQGTEVTFKVSATDDLGISTITLLVDDQPVVLNTDGEATVAAHDIGYLKAFATAIDSAGQSHSSSLQVRVRDPNEVQLPDPGTGTITGPGGPTGSGTGSSPIVTILSPNDPGDDLSRFIGTVNPNGGTLSSWNLSYAPASTVNLSNLADPSVAWNIISQGITAQNAVQLGTLDLTSLSNDVHVFRLLAYNTNGRGAVTSVVFNPLDTSIPQVLITSPANDSSITYLTEVRGTVLPNGGTLKEWYLDYAPSEVVDMQNLGEGSSWIRISSGNTPQTDSILGTLDTTMLRNDSYVFRLVAFNTSGRGYVFPATCHVTGDAKLGNFKLDFTDLQIPLAGIPITITRSYDTLEVKQQGDFGYGWKLGVQDGDIRETTPGIGGLFNANPYRVGTRVYVTTPDGRRIGFTFQPEFATGSLLGSVYRAKFIPDPGVYEKLSVPEGEQGFLSLKRDGTVGLAMFGFGWNPDEFIITQPDGTRFTYLQTAGLRTAVDLNGNKVTYTKDGIHHSNGSSIRFLRDSLGRITEIQDPDGKSIKYAYNDQGDLISVTDRMGNVTQFTYRATPAHYLEDVIDPLGRRAQRTEYGPDGRVVAVIDALGNRIEQNFDPANFSGTVTDARGNITTLIYNARGNLLEERKPEGGITRWEYNDAANPDKETANIDPRGNRTTYTYDARGNKLTETDPIGTVSIYTYNALNKITSLTRKDSTGTTLTTESATYDAAGNLTRFTDCAGNNRDFVYDLTGRLVSSTDFEGNLTQYDYMSGCRCGSPRKITFADGTTKLFEYNQFGQMTKETDESGAITRFTYDSNGRQISESDHDNNNNIFEYDNADNLIKRTDRLGRITKFQYDSKNRVTKEIKILTNDGNDTNDVILGYEYDGDGHLTALVDPVGNRTEFAFDRDGRLSTRKDAALAITTVNYDAAGNPDTITNRNGQKRSFVYDARNLPTAERWHDAGNNVIRSISTSLDAQGRRTQITAPDSTYTYQFDACSRVTQVSNAGTPSLPTVILNYTYDKDGHLESVTDNAGVSVQTTFDSRGHSDTFSWSGGGIAAASVDLDRNGRGQLTSIKRFNDGTLSNLVSCTTFDQIATQGWVKQIQHKNAAGALYNAGTNFTYGYDVEGQVTSQSSQGNFTTYGYDLTGQLTFANHTDVAYPDETYSYDKAGNRLTSHLHAAYTTGTANRLQSDGLFNYSYDAEGNLSTKTEIATGKVTTLAYDHRGRVTSIVERASAGGAILNQQSYVFDVLDRRITLNVNGTITHIAYHQDNAWADYTSAGVATARYLFADQVDSLLASWANPIGTTWYLTDQLGSVRYRCNSSGVIQDSLYFDTFGKTLVGSFNSRSSDRFGFTAREHGLGQELFYRSRFYSPATGRFTGEDKIGFDGGDSNLYRYVGNSPMDGIDPFGESVFQEYGTILRGVTVRAATGIRALGFTIFTRFQFAGAVVSKFGATAGRTFSAFGRNATKIAKKAWKGQKYPTINSELSGGRKAAEAFAKDLEKVNARLPDGSKRFDVLPRGDSGGGNTVQIFDRIEKAIEVIRFGS